MARRAATHLMFTGDASSALDLYASVFPSFRVEQVERYAEGDGNARGMVKRADASLMGHALIVIDSPVKRQSRVSGNRATKVARYEYGIAQLTAFAEATAVKKLRATNMESRN